MSKKAFLITVFIISLLLIGLMMLVADARIEVFDGFTSMEQKFQEANESSQGKLDSLEKELKTATKTDLETLKQFTTKADELLVNIQALKKEFISGKLSDQNYEELEKSKNEILFNTVTNAHSEQGKQFMESIEAYENAVAIIHLKFPITNTKSIKLREIIKDKDWLSYNFKDFPIIASYTKLTVMENVIQNKKEIIFTEVLTKQ